MYACQYEGLQMGQNKGVLFKEMAAFGRCPLVEVSLYSICFRSLVLVRMPFTPPPPPPPPGTRPQLAAHMIAHRRTLESFGWYLHRESG